MRIMPKMNCVVSLKGQWLEPKRGAAVWVFFEYFFGERDFFLDYQEIRPSAVFGTRMKAALPEKGFA